MGSHWFHMVIIQGYSPHLKEVSSHEHIVFIESFKEPQLRPQKLFVSGGCWWGSHPASILIGLYSVEIDSTNNFELTEGICWTLPLFH